MRGKFRKHFEKYDINDKNIIRKYHHSLRVMEISYNIAKNLNLSNNERYIAALIGLLHDYARFEQWTTYKTFNDKESVDHGDLAVKMLFEDGEIKQYFEYEPYYKIIYDAIKYHNKLEVDDSVSNKLFCNIIRDADKIDIFYLLSIDKSLFLEDDQEITLEINDDFFENKLIEGKKVKSKNDKVLYHLSYIFDINFKYSYKYINDNNLLINMYNNLDNKERFKKYFEYVDKYIKERID